MSSEKKMSSEDFYRKFTDYVRFNKSREAMTVLMTELAYIMLRKREDFIYMLRYAGVDVPENFNDENLINLFIENIGTNKRLLLGTAFIISHNNKVSGFDGEEYTSSICADAIYKCLDNHFNGFGTGVKNIDGEIIPEEMSNFEGDKDNLFYEDRDYSNVGGIADAVGALAGLGSNALQNVNQKREQKNKQANIGVDLLKSKQDAKAALVKGVLDIKSKEAEVAAAEHKTKRTQMIVIGSVAGALLLTVGIIILVKKLKKK